MFINDLLRISLCCLVGTVAVAQNTVERDTSKTLVNRLGEVFESGQIGVGYEYGLLPFYTAESLPAGNFKTEGLLGFSAWKVPLQLNYRYSTAGALSGINNYFTLRFDAQRYRQQLKQDLAQQQLERLNNLQQLKAQRGELAQKLGYLDAIHSPMNQANPSWKRPAMDSIGAEEPALPDAALPAQESPDLTTDGQNEQQRMQQQIDQLDRKIMRLEQLSRINQDSLVNHGRGSNALPGMNRAQKVMNGFQQLEVGMCYPDQYTFLIDRTPIRGINMAYQYNDLQLFFTHGKTLQPLFTTQGLVQNQMNPVNNMIQTFDMNNVDNGRRITAVKGGYGAPDETHLYVGALVGKGRASHWDSTNTEKEKNHVVEVDGRLKMSEAQNLSLVWGRSHTQIINPELSEGENADRNRLFDLGDRTHALMIRHEIAFLKTRTDLTTMVRWVDPYFKSHGVGFLRTHNLRYRVDVKQAIGKKLKVGGFVSREEDNLLKLYDYTTTLFSYGVNGQYRPFRSLNLKASVQPMVLTVDQQGESLNDANRNWITTAAAAWFRRKEERSLLVSALYSRFQLQQSRGIYRYENMQVLTTFSWSEALANESSYNFFHTNDTIGYRNTHLIQNDFTFRKGEVTCMLMAKAALTPRETQIGYGVSSTWQALKSLAITAAVEKVVLGERYYNLINEPKMNVPYYARLELIFQW